MSHEIEEHDNLVLYKTSAWHKLGNVVQDKITPTQALEDYGFDYTVEQWPLVAMDPRNVDVIPEFPDSRTLDSVSKPVKSHVVNIRSDTGNQLGVVSSKYQVLQNHELAEFCEMMSDTGNVYCESVGTIRNGQRIWFLLRGECFHVANADKIVPYILVSNGHDGSFTFRITPTTIRVVCSNTMHMVVPSGDNICQSLVNIRHTKNMDDRLISARQVFKDYCTSLEHTKEVIKTLASRIPTDTEVKRFFYECYSRDFGPVDTLSLDEKEIRKTNKALSAWDNFSKRFDDESILTDQSMWGAFNAYSGLIQHDQKGRGKNDENRIGIRINSNLFGLNQSRTLKALQTAFKVVS